MYYETINVNYFNNIYIYLLMSFAFKYSKELVYSGF